MRLEERIKAFSTLGERLRTLPEEELLSWAGEAKRNNPWFIDESVKTALKGVACYLSPESLQNWTSVYGGIEPRTRKRVGVVMAGNIPLVGFHDFLSVLISGNTVVAKLSSSDNVLLKSISRKLVEIEPRFSERIEYAEKLTRMDAVIATGSDNTARYFHYYFSKIPHIIRQNRVSCAVLRGDENREELQGLGKDILLYFGMGCRSVAKLFVPENYSFSDFYAAIESLKSLIDINKYYNNYDYNKSVFIINNTPFLDNGFLMVTPSQALASPVSVVYYEYYKSLGEVSLKLEAQQEKIQTIVSKEGWFAGSVPFGAAQFPSVEDYADGVDTLEFLQQLSS